MPAVSRSKSSKAKREASLRRGNKEAMYIGKASVVILYWEMHWDDHAQNVIPSFTIDVEMKGERTRRHRFETFVEAELKWKMLKREVAIKTAELALNLERPRE